MKTKQEYLAFRLESLVDETSLSEVLMALHLVCLEKTEHIEIIGQDKATAGPWKKAASATRKAAESVNV